MARSGQHHAGSGGITARQRRAAMTAMKAAFFSSLLQQENQDQEQGHRHIGKIRECWHNLYALSDQPSAIDIGAIPRRHSDSGHWNGHNRDCRMVSAVFLTIGEAAIGTHRQARDTVWHEINHQQNREAKGRHRYGRRQIAGGGG